MFWFYSSRAKRSLVNWLNTLLWISFFSFSHLSCKRCKLVSYIIAKKNKSKMKIPTRNTMYSRHPWEALRFRNAKFPASRYNNYFSVQYLIFHTICTCVGSHDIAAHIKLHNISFFFFSFCLFKKGITCISRTKLKIIFFY